MSVGGGATLFFKQGTAFTTSGNVVTPHSNGKFLVEAGFDWNTAGEAEYVDGPITVLGAGITTLHVGDEGVYSPMIVETASLDDEFLGTYFNTAPTSATVASAFGNYHRLSDVEHWTISKIAGASSGVQLSGLSPVTGATCDGNVSEGDDKIARLETTTWNEYSGASTTGEFAYVSFLQSLSTEFFDLGDDWSAFKLLPNPAAVDETIYCSGVGKFDASLLFVYDITGRQVLQKEVKEFQLSKAGMYIVKIVSDGKTKMKQLLIR